ncbi:MAG TPA: hypothetical protein VF665_05725 [Longimicrobium sp.]|uniref:hypothetical protein n=1 Tax=Longimicrobium sp. TaxID=2029185 RepID=UPI002EDADF68
MHTVGRNAPPLPPPLRDLVSTRVLLVAVPPLLGDIVRDALAAEPGVTVVNGGSAGELEDDVAAARADVLLAEDAGTELPDRYLRLMYRQPRLRLLLVSPDGRNAALWRMEPRRRALREVSPRALVDAVRAAAE